MPKRGGGVVAYAKKHGLKVKRTRKVRLTLDAATMERLRPSAGAFASCAEELLGRLTAESVARLESSLNRTTPLMLFVEHPGLAALERTCREAPGL